MWFLDSTNSLYCMCTVCMNKLGFAPITLTVACRWCRCAGRYPGCGPPAPTGSAPGLWSRHPSPPGPPPAAGTCPGSSSSGTRSRRPARCRRCSGSCPHPKSTREHRPAGRFNYGKPRGKTLQLGYNGTRRSTTKSNKCCKCCAKDDWGGVFTLIINVIIYICVCVCLCVCVREWL